MKASWEVKRLGEVCTVIAGQSPEGKFYNASADGLPFYQGKKEFSEKYIGKPTTWTTFVTKEAEKDDVLMSVRAPVGPINFSTEKICIGRGLAAIRASDLIDKDFLFNFLLKHEAEIVGNTGAVFDSINKSQIESILIPTPTLAEQQRIVAILDQAFVGIAKARANAEQNLQNARALFESYLQSVFTQRGEDWLEARLEDCFKLRSGDGLTSSMMKSDGAYSVFGGNGIAGKYDKFNLSGSNVIIGRVGALCGNVRHIQDSIWLTDNAFRVVHCKFDFDNPFLTYLLNYKDLRGFARQAAQPVISNSSLKDVILNFPKSIVEQKNIVAKLDLLRQETQRLEALYQRKIALLDELKKSLLQQAFAGEL